MSSLPTYTGATRPSSPSAGDAIYLSDVNKLAVYDGDISEWRLFNSDGLIYNAAAPNELHYVGGLYDSSSATYYVGSTPYYHLDASFINGQDTAGNPADQGAVQSWTDRVASISATQTSAANQATYVPFDSSANNKAALSFGGSAKYNLSSSISGLTSLTVLIVSRTNTGINYSSNLGSTSYQNSYWLKYTNGGDYVIGSNRGNFITQNQLEATSVYIVRRSGTDAEFRYNGGSSLWSGSHSNPQTVTQLGYNGLNYHKGYIYEIIIWDSALSDSDLNTSISYLGNKYGISTSAIS